jgi:vitamin B12/bleomycin/antimicrobial peptide transport system ATP-binding/permease protein
MAKRPSKLSNVSATAAELVAGPRLAPQMLMMVRAFWASRERNKILLLVTALVVVISATTFGQVKLNAWSQPFYDALAHKDLGGFFTQLKVFGIIAGGLLVLKVAQDWLAQMTRMLARKGLTRDLLDEWLKPRRAFRLVDAGEMGTNPDQHIEADVFILANRSTDLGVGLLQSSLLLGSFIGVLWILSQNVTFHLSGRSFVIPGYMVWCALVYAGTASWVSWRVGRPLIELNAKLHGRLGELRFALVRVNEHCHSVALYGGEQDEKDNLVKELERVLNVTRRLVTASTRLTWITAGYGSFTIIAPILVAIPGYLGGNLSFGGLMMVVGAFVQAQGALRWFIDNIEAITDWRATLLRIASFRQTVLTMDRLGATENRIEFVESVSGTLTFENLEVATPTGCTTLSERHVQIVPGERVLIVGEPGTGKTMLFRAIAGLWPWGGGRIALPSRDEMMFVPRQPYMPPRTLRAALAYPSPVTAYRDEELIAVLQCANLDRFSSLLDRNARWDRELTDDEQQSLVFARIVLHKPRWVVIDEVLDALDDDARNHVIRLFEVGLRDAAIIYIGRPETKHRYFERVLHLIKDPRGVCFIPDTNVASSGESDSSPRVFSSDAHI